MIRSLFLSVLFSTVLSAQEPRRGDTVVRLLADRVAADLGQVVLVAGQQRSASFDLTVNNLTSPVAAPARSFGLRAVAGDATLAEVKLPDAGKSFVVLLVSAAKGYTTVVLPSGDPAFKPGDVHFHNNTDKVITGSVGTAKFMLEPGKGRIVRPTGALPEKLHEVSFSVRERDADRVLSTSQWPVDEKVRSYVFFFVNPASGRVDFRSVEEFVETPVGR